MLVKLERKKSRLRRRVQFFAVIAGVVVLVLLADLARGPLVRAYRDRRQKRALHQAKTFLTSGDYRNALLALQVAARASPNNPAAWRVAAEALETAGSNEAVRLREQILATDPESLAHQLALAATALRFQEFATAESALASVAPAHRNSPEYLKIVAALAFAQKRTQLADAALEQLLQLEPDNAQMKFNRAVIRLRHSNSELAAAARSDLAAQAKPGSPTQLAALRELARDAGVRRRPEEGRDWAARLIAVPEATFDDALLRLNLLRLEPGSTEAPAAEQALAVRAAKSPADAAAFATWLVVQNRTQEARNWFKTVAPAIRISPGVRSVEAECLAALGDWNALATLLKAGAWGPVAPEIVDLAFSARTLHEHQRAGLRRSVWQESLELARADAVTLRALLRLALYWQWVDEAEATLLATGRNFPHETWAFNALISSAYGRKDTGMLRTAYGLFHEAQPANRRVAGDWAMVSLLTEPTSAENQVKIVARELHLAEPRNPFFTTTYALALHQQNRTAEAVALMEQLAPAELRVPGRALYYALFLASSAQPERARTFLEFVAGANLLPEEKTLLQETRARVESGLHQADAF